jgi:hypothetical protein
VKLYPSTKQYCVECRDDVTQKACSVHKHDPGIHRKIIHGNSSSMRPQCGLK